MITALEFSLHDQKFLTNAIKVDSIIRYTADVVLTKLPEYGDESTIGVLKYQDKIYHIKDSAKMLGYESDKKYRNFILLFNNQIGLLVDNVSRVLNIHENDLDKSPVVSQHIKDVYIDNNIVFPYVEV